MVTRRGFSLLSLFPTLLSFVGLGTFLPAIPMFFAWFVTMSPARFTGRRRSRDVRSGWA